MANSSEMIGRRLARFCARFALVVCVLAMAFGASLEHASAEHVETTEIAMTAHHGGSDQSGKAAAFDHGCHACAAINVAKPVSHRAPAIVATVAPWSSQPAMDGREPFAELRPPRA